MTQTRTLTDNRTKRDTSYTYSKITNRRKIKTLVVYLLWMGQKLIECMFVVFQTGHCHQETLNDLPGLPSVVGLCVSTLQTIKSRLDCLRRNKLCKSNFNTSTIFIIKLDKVATVLSFSKLLILDSDFDMGNKM